MASTKGKLLQHIHSLNSRLNILFFFVFTAR